MADTTKSLSLSTIHNSQNPAWKHTIFPLLALTVLAFGLRVVNLSAVGLAEDEVHKIEAVTAYRHGDFTPNAEHPMLMKLAMTASVVAAEDWNHSFPAHQVAPETALRLPNCLLGALTTLVLGLLAAELFSPAVGLMTAALWATGMLAIATNRIGKEDTFLVFFLWLAYFCYFHAKKLGTQALSAAGCERQAWWYIAAGASFGFMLASKYFPHYWGLLFLWEYLDHKLRPGNPLTNPIPRGVFPRFYGAMAVCFLLANPIVWLPSTISYLVNYVSEETVTHHGYLLMGTLYFNNPSRTAFSGGLPLYFYPLMLWVKTPPIVLMGLLVGGWVTLRRLARSPYFFLVFMLGFWLVPFSIIGGKWMRYSLSLLPMVYMVAAIGICQLSVVSCQLFHHWQESSPTPDTRHPTPNLWLAIVVFVLALVACLQQAPFYGLYVNAFGGGPAQAGNYFPHDEFYDAGMREALAYVARTAPTGATVVTETPSVVNYYSAVYHRPDLASAILSDEGLQLNSPGVKYVIVQKGRRYFENADRMDHVMDQARLCQEIRVAGQVAAQVYVMGSSAPTGNMLMVSAGTNRGSRE